MVEMNIHTLSFMASAGTAVGAVAPGVMFSMRAHNTKIMDLCIVRVVFK